MATSNTNAIVRSQKIVFVGNGIAGKTCLLNSFFYNQWDPNPSVALEDMNNTEIHIDNKKSVSK
jgi:GTPase SAR1 family protein